MRVSELCFMGAALASMPQVPLTSMRLSSILAAAIVVASRELGPCKLKFTSLSHNGTLLAPKKEAVQE